jgi:GT2 family glycosyltransferase
MGDSRTQTDAILPLVTVITPAYNRARYLPETIESILQQDYPHIQYIVLDDGSTDETPDVLDRYRGRITALRHDNHGQAWTVNRGFEHAEGEFICLVNSDDPLPQGAIRRLVDVLLANPDIMLAYPNWNMVDEDGEYLQHISPPDYSYVDMVRWFMCMPGPGALFRRTLVECAGGWDPSNHYCPDFEWFLRAGLCGPFLHINETLAQWRQHEGSITTTERGLGRAHEYSRMYETFFARDDLPDEIRAIEAEAHRNAYITAALTMTHDPSAPNHRFVIMDNLNTVLANPEHRRRPTSRTKDGIIADLSMSLSQAAEAIEWLNGLAYERDAQIAAYAESAADQAKGIASRDEAIEWLHGIVSEREAQIAVLQATLAEQEQGIASRDEAVVWLKDVVSEREAQIAAYAERVAWLEGIVAEQEQGVAARDEAIAWLQQKIAEREGEAARDETEIAVPV